MTHSFDKEYWEQHWNQTGDPARGSGARGAANPHLVRETTGLAPGTALDAGCGTGAEAIWLAEQGWQVTAADISAAALGHAADSAAQSAVADRVTWVEADLTTWAPNEAFDLVVTNYAHPAIPQLVFYDRIANWVAPGGTLLVVGHLQHAGQAHEHEHGHGHDDGHNSSAHPDDNNEPPVEATVTLADIAGRLDPADWHLDTIEEQTRPRPGGHGAALHDVILRAHRLV